MTISYSTNFEDVILQRVFRHIQGGFYIDVGACAPIAASNTWALYWHLGWRGVVVEPLIGMEPLLLGDWKQWRPEDTLVTACASGSEGFMPFYRCEIDQLSTGSLANLRHWRKLGSAINGDDFFVVTAVTLDSILAQCQPPDFHLLCIDVEGMEENVLAGLDLQRYRPWVLCIECMLPATTEESVPWEARLLAHGYRRIYEDRSNTWYLADEHPELAEHFRYPPNYTDQIQTYREVRLEHELQALRDKYEQPVEPRRPTAEAEPVESRRPAQPQQPELGPPRQSADQRQHAGAD